MVHTILFSNAEFMPLVEQLGVCFVIDDDEDDDQ